MSETSPKRRRAAMPADEMSASAKHAANARWAKTADRRAATQAARDARRAGYYAEADRQGVTDPELREAMARNAMAAEMARMRYLQLRRQRAARLAREVAAADAQDGAEAGDFPAAAGGDR